MTITDDINELPFVDVHSTEIAAPPEIVFEAFERIGPRLGTDRLSTLYARLVGTEDAGAFHVARAERPGLVVLAGSHRFSRYQLALRIEPSGSGSSSTVHAETRAVFPGLGGRVYRAAVIGTGGHRVAMKLLLRGLKGRVEHRPG
jgi:hypothetical protein